MRKDSVKIAPFNKNCVFSMNIRYTLVLHVLDVIIFGRYVIVLDMYMMILWMK